VARGIIAALAEYKRWIFIIHSSHSKYVNHPADYRNGSRPNRRYSIYPTELQVYLVIRLYQADRDIHICLTKKSTG
jgi:hypothetical protein